MGSEFSPFSIGILLFYDPVWIFIFILKVQRIKGINKIKKIDFFHERFFRVSVLSGSQDF